MITVRTSVVAVAVCLLAACARSGTTQTGCEESTQTFPEMAGCLKTVVDRRYAPRPPYSPDLNLYFVRVGHITERVRTNDLSDFNGRVELQRAYLALTEPRPAK